MDNPGTNEAAGRLAEAIDDFLGDIEKKFKGISDEILTKRESLQCIAFQYIISVRAKMKEMEVKSGNRCWNDTLANVSSVAGQYSR